MLLSLKHIVEEFFHQVLGPVIEDTRFTLVLYLNCMSRGVCYLTFPHHIIGKDLSTQVRSWVIYCINQEALLVMMDLLLVPDNFSEVMLEFIARSIPRIRSMHRKASDVINESSVNRYAASEPQEAIMNKFQQLAND